MTMSPSTPYTSHSNSLPPLHQAIPEFHSHDPRERRSASVPRRMVGRGSPSFRQPPRVSPSSSSALSDNGRSTPNREYMDTSYDAQTYIFPGHLESRRVGVGSSGGGGGGTGNGVVAPSSSVSMADTRPSPYLPPVSSLTLSRGSSFDMDASERPAPLPQPYNSHHQSVGHSGYGGPQYEHEAARSQQTTPDYHRYPSNTTISPSPYQSSSPGTGYSQPYYSHSTGQYASQQPRPQTGYSAHQSGSSQFSGMVPSAELSMDQFNSQGKNGKRRRGNLPKQVTDHLRAWLNDHLHHPYPTEEEKQRFMEQTGLTIHQVSNWFINARRRRIPAITSGSRSPGSRRATTSPSGGPRGHSPR